MRMFLEPAKVIEVCYLGTAVEVGLLFLKLQRMIKFIQV